MHVDIIEKFKTNQISVSCATEKEAILFCDILSYYQYHLQSYEAVNVNTVLWKHITPEDAWYTSDRIRNYFILQIGERRDDTISFQEFLQIYKKERGVTFESLLDNAHTNEYAFLQAQSVCVQQIKETLDLLYSINYNKIYSTGLLWLINSQLQQILQATTTREEKLYDSYYTKDKEDFSNQ